MASMKSSFCKNQRGFTLIEVLVASTIVIMSIGTLLQLFSAGLNQNHKVGQLAHLLSAQRTITARLEQINLAKQQTGDGIAQGLNYQWKAKIDKPYRSIGGQDENKLTQKIALQTIFVQIEKPRGGKYLFDFQQLSWHFPQ